MRLLAVDDDEIALDILGRALKASGYEQVETCTSGNAALKLLQQPHLPFDAFLLDIRMPGLNGIELCARIREMPRYMTTPVIMITAMSDRSYIDAAFAAGALDYINKPFDAIELVTRLRVAEKIVDQDRAMKRSQHEIEWLRSQTAFVRNFSANDAVEIVEVPRVISMTAMENYLLRLTRSMAFHSESVAFTIKGFDTLFAQTGSDELYDILCDTAEAIVSALKREDHLVTYCGSGTFVAVLNRNSLAHDPDMLTNVAAMISAIGPCFADGERAPVDLEMSPIYAPRLWAAGNPLNLLNVPRTVQVKPIRIDPPSVFGLSRNRVA